ncbi:MAG: alpha/beta hydrolase [Pseudomonadota bacterium]
MRRPGQAVISHMGYAKAEGADYLIFMADSERNLDLDIISNSWRSVSEADAFDDLIVAWDRKLEASNREPRIPLIDGILKRQLGSIESFLDRRSSVRIEDPIEAALAETPAPAMVLSPNGLVVAMNDGATHNFAVNQGVEAGTGWLRDESYGDFQAVRNSGLGRSNVDYAIVRTVLPNGGEALAEVYQLDANEDAQSPSYTVVRSLELEWLPDVPKTLKKVFGLTKAEAEICKLLFANRDLDAVAKARAVTLGTVRNQVKQILSKTDARSKAQLIRLLAMLCARAGLQQEKTDLSWSDPFGREKIHLRQDGRKLAHSWAGAEDGRPILFLAAQTTFYFLPETLRQRFADAGIKLICPSMPGYGRSDPARHSDQLTDGCDALEDFCEAQAFGPIPVFASRGEQFYSILLAHMRPDLISRLTCMGLPWRLALNREKSVDLPQRTALRLALNAPAAYDLVFTLAYRLVKKWGPDFYLGQNYGDTALDRETCANPEVQPLIRSVVRHMLAQGPDALKSEHEFAAKTPIKQRVQELQMPLHWLIPKRVGLVEERDLDHVRGLNPMISAEIIPDTGELLPYQKPDLFFERVCALVATNPGLAPG